MGNYRPREGADHKSTHVQLAWIAALWAVMAEPFTLELPVGTKWTIEPPTDSHGDGYTRTALVRIHASGLQAHTTFRFSDGLWNPAHFVSGLAADWRLAWRTPLEGP